MNATQRFCTNCGSPLRPGIRFCGQCGAPVAQAPVAAAPVPPVQPMPAAPQPPPPAAAPAMQPAPAEPIVAILPSLQRRKGFLGMSADTFNLILTPGRMVFAMVSPQLMKDSVVAARNEAKGQGKGFFGQWTAQMAWVDVLCRQYQSMPLDAIMTQYPGSFVILNAQVTRVRLKESSIDDDSGQSSPAQLTFETMAGKFTFNLPGMSARDARRLLQQTLPHAVR
jgi:hypothetical protein